MPSTTLCPFAATHCIRSTRTAGQRCVVLLIIPQVRLFFNCFFGMGQIFCRILCSMLGEQLLHHRIAHLRSPILVHHALVVVRFRAVHRPFLRHAAVRELPQEHAAARRVRQNRLHLIAQNCALPLLRPLRFAQRVMVAVNAARADFADDGGASPPRRARGFP